MIEKTYEEHYRRVAVVLAKDCNGYCPLCKKGADHYPDPNKGFVLTNEKVMIYCNCPYSISGDGKTVWVNGAAGLLGRFSKNMIDVHVDGTCVDDSCGRGTWKQFQKKMFTHHRIAVSDDFEPKKGKK